MHNEQNIEITSMLTLSTAHISPKTREILDANGILNIQLHNKESCYLTIYPKSNIGWFCYIHKTNPQNTDIQIQDLNDCINLAIKNNCDIICFDRDGEIYENILPTYDD